MKKRTSNLSRRVVSLLMSMVLTLTLVTPAAFATEVVDGSGEGTGVPVAQRTVTVKQYHANEAYEVKIVVGVEADGTTEKLDTTYTINADTKTVTLRLTKDGNAGEPVYIKTALNDVLVTEGENQTPALTTGEPTLEYTLPNEGDVTLYYGTQADFNAPVAQRKVTVEKYRTDAAYEVKIVVGVEEDGITEKLDTTYTIDADTKTVTLKLTTDGYEGEPIYIKTALDDVLVTEDDNKTPKTPALTKDTTTLEYPLPEDGDVTLYYGTQADFVSAWYGDGTATDYTIRSAEELAHFAQLVNGGNNFAGKTVTLARDIDLSAVCHPADEENGIAEVSWTPIGNWDNDASFFGVFDGNEKEIVNLYINSDEVFYVGLFDNVVAGGIVRNLTVDGTIIAQDPVSVGGIVALLFGGTVTNCANRVSITITTRKDAIDFFAGGVVGHVYGDEGGDEGFGSSTVNNCINSGSIDAVATVSGCIGGVVGALGDTDPDSASVAEGTIQLCKNSGSIRVTGCKKSTWVGGIIGLGTGGTLVNCFNSGAVICTADRNQDLSFVGGVIGSSGDFTNENDDASDYAISINACENSGAVCATDTNKDNSMAWAGGIAGFSYGAIRNAANTGSVQGQGNTGGIVGINMPAAVSNCYNWGDVIDNRPDSIVSGIGFVTDDGEDGSLALNSYYICKVNSDDTVDMKYINKAEQEITYEEASHAYKVGENTLVKTLNENRGNDDLKWFVNIPEGITKPIFVKLWDGTDHPDYVPDGTEKEVHVTYDPNDGSGGRTVAVTVTLNEDGTVKAPGSHTILTAEDAGVEKDNNEFKDWNTAADGSGTSYDPNDVISVSEDLTLYAQWQPLWKGSGTESDPYQIENEADWLKMQKYAEKYEYYHGAWFALMNDITLDSSYEPFNFAGNLKGNYHTITVNIPKATENGKHSRGLFKTILGGSGGILIENLTIAGSVTAQQYAGGLAGSASSKVTLENVTSNVTVQAGSDQYDRTSAAGGLFGVYNGGSVYPLTVKNCTNSGTVTAPRAAGFVAHMSSNAVMSFSGCRNTGVITGKGGYGDGYAAGFVSIYNAYNLTCTFENCANSGAISANARAAGIAISCRLAANCTNSGTISGNITGGILDKGAVKYSTNTGEISGKSCAAGIASSANSGSMVEFCANFGKVTATAGSGAAKPAYGIASQGTVKNCFTYNNEMHVPVAGKTGRNCIVTNSYYLANSKDEFPITMGGEYATLADFASGKVAWGVDGGEGAHTNYWTQIVGRGQNQMPAGPGRAYPKPIEDPNTEFSVYRALVQYGTGGTASLEANGYSSENQENAVYGMKGTSVAVTATPKDDTFGLKSLTLDLMGTGSTAALESGDSFTLGEANALVVAAFASTGNGGNGGGTGGNGGDGDGSGTDTGDGAGDEDDEGLQDGLNLEVEYDVKGLILSAYGAWGAEGSGKTFAQWLKDSPEVLRALITNSLDNMAVAAMGKKTDEAKDLAALLLASLNEHSGLNSKNGDIIGKALQRYMDTGSEATFSTWLTTGSGMASGTVEEILAQYTDSLLDLTERLYTNWESSGTSLTFPQWLDAQQVTMESLSENAEEPEAEPDDTQTSEAPEDVPDGQEAEGGASGGGNSVWEVIGTVVRENPIIVWSIVAVVAALIIVGAVRRYHKVKRDERDDVASKK